MATPTFFTGILGALIAITIVLFVIAQSVVEPDLKLDDAAVASTVIARIEPVGKLNTGNAPVLSVIPSPIKEAQAAPDFGSGEDVYNTVCQACHSTGVLNSPILGDRASWGERPDKGAEALYTSVIQGMNLMPPKGGRPDLSDDQIRMAVDYMLEKLP